MYPYKREAKGQFNNRRGIRLSNYRSTILEDPQD
jgi:hypothetical protein